ncbi:hypothetical protein VUR80DRAFT_6618 [Thermomyces stellatus]
MHHGWVLIRWLGTGRRGPAVGPSVLLIIHSYSALYQYPDFLDSNCPVPRSVSDASCGVFTEPCPTCSVSRVVNAGRHAEGTNGGRRLNRAVDRPARLVVSYSRRNRSLRVIRIMGFFQGDGRVDVNMGWARDCEEPLLPKGGLAGFHDLVG